MSPDTPAFCIKCSGKKNHFIPLRIALSTTKIMCRLYLRLLGWRYLTKQSICILDSCRRMLVLCWRRISINACLGEGEKNLCCIGKSELQNQKISKKYGDLWMDFLRHQDVEIIVESFRLLGFFFNCYIFSVFYYDLISFYFFYFLVYSFSTWSLLILFQWVICFKISKRKCIEMFLGVESQSTSCLYMYVCGSLTSSMQCGLTECQSVL